MSKLNGNTIRITTPFYILEAHDQRYNNIVFLPFVFVSRKDSKNIDIYISIQQFNTVTKKGKFVRNIRYSDHLLVDEIIYYKELQNSNFANALPNSVKFLAKLIETIQQIVSKGPQTKATETVNVTATPSSTYPEGSCSCCLNTLTGVCNCCSN